MPAYNAQGVRGPRPLDPDRWSPPLELRTRDPDWSEPRLRAALTDFTAGRERWPSFPEFQMAGLAMLHVQVERHGGHRRWSRLLDLPYFAPRSEVGAWPEERIRTELRGYLHDRAVWPSVKQFAADGHGALRRAVNWTGGQAHWAREMGVELAPRRAPHTRWTDARIRADLARFLKGRTEWPPRREFYAAGLGGLYCAIRSRHKREALAAELDLRLPQGRVYGRKRWTDDAIRHALGQMLDGRDTWPTRHEFREAGLGTLHGVLTETRTRDEWATLYALPLTPTRRSTRGHERRCPSSACVRIFVADRA